MALQVLEKHYLLVQLLITQTVWVSGSELVQKYIGEGSWMVRKLFVMARYTFSVYVAVKSSLITISVTSMGF